MEGGDMVLGAELRRLQQIVDSHARSIGTATCWVIVKSDWADEKTYYYCTSFGRARTSKSAGQSFP
jgi:hypothetical protein